MEENDANLTEYELERKRKIARNQALIAQLDLKSLASKVAPEKPKRANDGQNKRGPKGAHARKRMKPQRFSSRADKLKKQQRLTNWKGQRIGSLRTKTVGRFGGSDFSNAVVTTEVVALGRVDPREKIDEKENANEEGADGANENADGRENKNGTSSTSKAAGGSQRESMQTADFLTLKYNMAMGKSHLKNAPEKRKRGRPRLDEMEWGRDQNPPPYAMVENALIPRRYLAEGECFDEPYFAWVDEHQKHHLIWGRDDASKGQKSVQTAEEGVDTPSEAAVLILEELQRREFEKWESEREENLKTAIAQKIAMREDLLAEAYYPYGREQLPSRFKNLKPVSWYQQQQQKNASIVNINKVSAIYADPASEEARKMRLWQDLQKAAAAKSNTMDKYYRGVLQCSTCGKSFKDTPKMRSGQLGMEHLCTACGLFYATFGRKRPIKMKEFEELPIQVQRTKHESFVKLEEEARLKALEKQKKDEAENTPQPESDAAPVKNEEAKPKLVFTMKSSTAGEGENANKVVEDDAEKWKRIVTCADEQPQTEKQQVDGATDVKDTAATTAEPAKPSLKIVMHRSYAAPDSNTEGKKDEEGIEEDAGATMDKVKREADEEVEEEAKTVGVSGDWKTAKFIGLNHCARLEFAEQVQKAIPTMGEMTKLLTLVGAGLMTKDMVEEGILPDEDAISQMQPWIAQLNPTKLPPRYLANARAQILPPSWSNPDVGFDAIMFAANIVHTTPLMINPIKLRKYEPKDIDGDMIFGYGQCHVQDSLIAFRDRDEEWQTPVPEHDNEMDEDAQDELDAMRDHKETLERESRYEEEGDQTMYIQGVNKAISSVQKAKLKEYRDSERIKERTRRAKEHESEKKRLRMQMALQPIRFMTPREREKYLYEKQLKLDAKNGKLPSAELSNPLVVTMKKSAETVAATKFKGLGMTSDEAVAGRDFKGIPYEPKEIPVICGKLTGVLKKNGRPRINLTCRIDSGGQHVGVTEFERQGGSKKKKWKTSIKVRFKKETHDSEAKITLGEHLIESGKEFDNNGEVIGKKVAVYQSIVEGFRIGTITKFFENSGEHRIEYEDRKPEELYLFLMNLKWEPEFIGESALAAEDAQKQVKEEEEEEHNEEKKEQEEDEEEKENFENLSDLELVQKIGKPAGAPGKSGAKYPISIGPYEVYTIYEAGVSEHNPMRMSERRKCLEILRIVRSAEGRGKGVGKMGASSTRFLVEMFELLPNKSQLPEYYQIIRYPIDIATIEFSLKSGVYASPWWFFVALELVFANAQRYNDPASQMYADAAALRECMRSAAKELFGPDVPFPKVGGDIYDDIEEPREYRETRIVPYEINDEENPFAGDDVVYRDHREILTETSALYHPPAQVSPKTIREEIEREKAAIDEYGYEAVKEEENEQAMGGERLRGRTKIRYENKPMEIPSLKRGPYKKRKSKETIKLESSDDEEDYESGSDSDFTRKKKPNGEGGRKRGRPSGTRESGMNDTTAVAISLLERYSQLGTVEFMEKIEARGGRAGSEWSKAGRKAAAFNAYMRNKSDIFTEVTSVGSGIWSLVKGFSKIEPRHMPDRAARRQLSVGAEGDDDEDDDDYDDDEDGREAKVSKNATIARTNVDGGSAWEWKNTDGTMTQKATDVCHSILRSIRCAVEPETKRLRSELFELLPTSRVLPEYYKAIANPIDLRSITKCLRDNGYASIWSFLLALELCFSNAQSFNEEDSQIYEDAEELRKVGNDALRKLVPGHPVPVRDSCYDIASVIEPPWEKVKPKLTFTMKHKDDNDDVAKALSALQASGKCGKCSVCTNKNEEDAAESCITERMLCVARDTKLDLALLAAKGKNAVGVKLEIFWPGEDTWYPAVISSFDELSCQHVCEYVEDSTEDKLALWDDSNWEEGTKIRIL